MVTGKWKQKNGKVIARIGDKAWLFASRIITKQGKEMVRTVIGIPDESAGGLIFQHAAFFDLSDWLALVKALHGLCKIE